MNSITFREIVSGRRRGILASGTRALLSAAELPYAWAVAWRNRRFDQGRAPSCRAAVPVISVGNVTVGGTGKTPMVAWLARWFLDREVRVAVVSRGYGARPGTRNDEALELELELPHVPHVQDPDRIAAARQACTRFDARLILLDDAFQHRRIERDLDLVLVDALEPFGYRHLLPRGLLREPLSGLGRAEVIAISRCDLVDADMRQAIARQLRDYAPQAALVEVSHRPRGLINFDGQRLDAAGLSARPFAVFCGIGNADGFRRTLESMGLDPTGFREFADHHRYTPADIESLESWSASLKAASLVCTRKDLVKIARPRLGATPLWALEIGIDFLAGRADLEERLQSILNRCDLTSPTHEG